MKRTAALLGAIALVVCWWVAGTPQAMADEFISHAPKTARVYIIEPQNGDTVTNPFTIQFGLSGMEVAPAGVEKVNSGHHHLLVDVAELPDMRMSLPKSDSVRHFGKGQTETELTLPPGKHTLQLLLGNHLHIPHDNPVLSDKIEITVEPS
ncbi:MAG: DUF4399 domain-containing protein [Cyanobacteria bacterium P01_E01_bin.34]